MAWRIQATYASTHDPDFVYALATIGLISGLELWLGIIVACMPTIPPVIQAYVQPAFHRLSSYYQSRQGRSRDKASSSLKPEPSHDNIQLNGRMKGTFGTPGTTTPALSTDGLPLPSTYSVPMASPTAFESGLRSQIDRNTYVTIDDQSFMPVPHISGGAGYPPSQRVESRVGP